MTTLFRTGFAVDAIAPVASTSTLPGAPGSASRKRKRANAEDKASSGTKNGDDSKELARTSQNSNVPSKKHGKDKSAVTGAAAGIDQISQKQNVAVEGPQVNIEKLMKKLQQMEGTKSRGSDNKKSKKESTSSKADNVEAQSLSSVAEDKQASSPQSHKKAKKAKQDKSNGNDIGNDASAKAKRSNLNKPDYVPDEAALAKREERKKKKAAKLAAAAAAAADTASQQGHDSIDEVSTMDVETIPTSRQDGESTDALVPQSSQSGTVTDLQKKMQKKLGGARFRWINEQLYTTSGDTALNLMKEDPALFQEYHSGFRSQAASWPEQPIHNFIRYFETKYANNDPKPVIADLGCGEAELAQTLVLKGFPVLSYDLVEQLPYVVRAQCTERLPLPGAISSDDTVEAAGAIVDYVVCCLSLMGNDWLGMIREAKRVLRIGGKLKIAEVTSRFTDVDTFVDLLNAHGFKLLSKDTGNTHFALFEFQSVSKSQTKSSLSQSSQADLTRQSIGLLKPCIYKRR